MMQSKNSKTSSEEELSSEQHTAKRFCEQSHLLFSRYFFKQRENISFRVNWHHKVISDALERVISGEIKNLIINVPPGSSKTELAVINFIARGLALNPRARFLHLSYSDDLALGNSKAARDLISSEEFQELWPMQIADDAKAKKRWNVMVNGREAGGVYATSLQGQITGFRAGRMKEGFWGALIIDDPLKPEDAFSKVKLQAANRRLISTVKSRKANPDTPIILIMQRIAENDPTGFILGGSLGGEWHHIVIPAVIDDHFVETKVDEKYRAEVERDATDRFSYWPYKERITDLLQMEAGGGTDPNGQKVSRFVFSSQWMQAPKAIGGNIIQGDWFPRYRILPKIQYRKIFADTAQKTKERNDYSVFQCWGLGVDGKLYLLDQIRGKWEAPELKRRALAFWAKHKPLDIHAEYYTPPPGIPGWAGQLRRMKVEDKASGTGLIQELKLVNGVLIEAIQRDKDKLTRAMDAQPYMDAGLVCLPEEAPFTSDFISEAEAFTADDTHEHDDQLDPAFDAVEDMLSTQNKIEQWKKLVDRPHP